MRILRAKQPLGQIKRIRRSNDLQEEHHGDQFEIWVMQRAFDTSDAPCVLKTFKKTNIVKQNVDLLTQLIDINKDYFDNDLIPGDEIKSPLAPSVQAEMFEIPPRDDFITINSEVNQFVELLKNFQAANNYEIVKYLKKLKDGIYLTVKEKLRKMYSRGNFTTTYSFLFFTGLWGKLEDNYYYTYHDIHKNSLLIPFANIRSRYDQILALYNHLAEGKGQSYLVWILVDYEVNSPIYDMKLPRNINISTEFQNMCFKKAVVYQTELICRLLNPRPPIIPIEVKRLIRNLVIYKNNPKYICSLEN